MKDHKAHRSRVKQSYYAQQFSVTAANKKRRADKRERRRVLALGRKMLALIPSRHESKAPAANSQN